MQGLIHVYTGDGKGKTTAALGLGMRAAGAGLRVLMIQLLKDSPSGELNAAKAFGDGFKIMRFQKGKKGFIWEMTEEEINELKTETQNALKYAEKAMNTGECDVLILDEIFGCIGNLIITEEDVLSLLKRKKEAVEIVLTGRNAPESIINAAHYVTEMRAVKHPLYSGISARKGIEY